MKKLIQKMRGAPITLKASIAVFLSSVLLKGIAFITIPIFTRILGTEQYGTIALYNSWLSILEVFAVLGLTSAGSFNVGLNDNKNEPYRYMANCLCICNCATIICFLIIFVLKKFCILNLILPNNLLLLMFIHLFFYPAQIFWIFYQRYEYKYKLSTTLVVVSTVLGQVLSVYGVLNSSQENGAFIKLLYTELLSLFVSVPLYFVILIKGKIHFNIQKWKVILKYIIPLIPHYLAQHIMASADKIMIAKYIGNAQAGIYSVVLNIAMIFDVMWSAVSASLIPYTFKKIEEKKYDEIKKTSNVLVIIFSILCVIIMLIAPEVMKILAPEKYYIGVYLVPALMLVSFTKVLYNLFANIEFYYKKSDKILLATLIATAVNLLLNQIFIPRFGFIAAAYTTLISYILLIIMHYVGYKECDGKNSSYNDKFIFKILFLLMIIAGISYVLYLNTYIRYTVLVAVCIIGILKKNVFIKNIKELLT